MSVQVSLQRGRHEGLCNACTSDAHGNYPARPTYNMRFTSDELNPGGLVVAICDVHLRELLRSAGLATELRVTSDGTEPLELFLYCLLEQVPLDVLVKAEQKTQRYFKGLPSHRPPQVNNPLRQWAREVARRLLIEKDENS